MICSAASSKLTNNARSPRRHAASANLPARVVLAVPGTPVISVLLPRNTPPPSMASRRSKPAVIRSLDARCSISARSAAPTSMPDGPMLIGNSASRVARAPILGDLNALCGDAVLLASLQAHHAIDHELQEVIVHEAGGAIVDFGRDDRSQGVVRKPVAQAVDFPHFRAPDPAAASAARRSRRRRSTARRSPSSSPRAWPACRSDRSRRPMTSAGDR